MTSRFGVELGHVQGDIDYIGRRALLCKFFCRGGRTTILRMVIPLLCGYFAQNQLTFGAFVVAPNIGTLIFTT